MFNLIVAGHDAWRANRGSFTASRVLEYTTEPLKEQFMPGNALDVAAVMRLPTIFMNENGTSSAPVARVGKIRRLHLLSGNYELEYTFDDAISPIPNSKLDRLAAELEIHEWEFSRTHWAIKDVDLFYVLLKQRSMSGSARVFNLLDDSVDSNLVSVMMPFSAAFNDVFTVLQNAAQSSGKRCLRADQIWHNDMVIQDVVELICTSSVVICDLSGKNPNVFYETGIAHAVGQNVILIAQSSDDVPFDINHLRHIRYLNNAEGLVHLAESVRRRLQSLAERDNRYA